jgi:hypothetical protein
MNVHQAIAYVEKSNLYQKFKKDNPHYYLAHGFCTFEKEKQSSWNIGYYSKKTKKITSFVADGEVVQLPADEAFRKEGHVAQLNEKDILVDLNIALEQAEQYRVEHHRAEDVMKTIILVQYIDDEPTWNITLITNIFSLINVRTSAKSGKLLKVTADSVLNLGARI